MRSFAAMFAGVILLVNAVAVRAQMPEATLSGSGYSGFPGRPGVAMVSRSDNNIDVTVVCNPQHYPVWLISNYQHRVTDRYLCVPVEGMLKDSIECSGTGTNRQCRQRYRLFVGGVATSFDSYAIISVQRDTRDTNPLCTPVTPDKRRPDPRALSCVIENNGETGGAKRTVRYNVSGVRVLYPRE